MKQSKSLLLVNKKMRMKNLVFVLILVSFISCKKENISNELPKKDKYIVLKSNIEKDGYLCDMCMVDNIVFYIAKEKLTLKASDRGQPAPTGTFINEEYVSPTGGCHRIIDCAGEAKNCYKDKDLSIVKVTCID